MAYQPNIVGKNNRLWPQVTTWDGGVIAAKQGRWACVFIAFVSIAASLYSLGVKPIFDVGQAGALIFQGLAFIPIAIGVHKHSRIAMVLGLAWYSLDVILSFMETREIPNFVAVLLILMLINGTRGVFAVHRIPEPADIDPAERVRSMQRSE